MAGKERIAYVESGDFIPKELRKMYGLGEYAKKSTPAKKTPAKKGTTKKSK